MSPDVQTASPFWTDHPGEGDQRQCRIGLTAYAAADNLVFSLLITAAIGLSSLGAAMLLLLRRRGGSALAAAAAAA